MVTESGLGVGIGNQVACSRVGGREGEAQQAGVLPGLGVPLEAVLWALEMGFLPSWQVIVIKINILNCEVY